MPTDSRASTSADRAAKSMEPEEVMGALRVSSPRDAKMSLARKYEGCSTIATSPGDARVEHII